MRKVIIGAMVSLDGIMQAPNGIVIAKYVRDGAVKTGDFAMDPPTPAEVARREKMKREG